MGPLGDVEDLLRREFYTTPEEQDPTKPVILDGEFVRANPKFDPNLVSLRAAEADLARRRENLGTSFFLNFDPAWGLHQISGPRGDRVRHQIAHNLQERFIIIFISQFPDDDPMPFSALSDLDQSLAIGMAYQPQAGANNGEIFFWLRGICLTEDFTFQFLKDFRRSLQEYPVTIEVDGTEYPILFYGCGFRYY